MTPPKPMRLLKGLGSVPGAIIVVDPGKTTGFAIVQPAILERSWAVYSFPLDDLPWHLRRADHDFNVSFVLCEDYHLAGGNRRNAGATDMPSAQGIGMCRSHCYWTDTLMYLAQPNAKRAGEAYLMKRFGPGSDARLAARNDHQRDVCDLAGAVLREMSLPAPR